MIRILIISLILIAPDAQSCKTARNETGNCIKITECDPMFKILKNAPIIRDNIEYLRNSQCGIAKRIPKVCCPLDYKVSSNNVNQNDDVGMMPKDLLQQMTNTSQAYQETNGTESEVMTLDDLLIEELSLPDRKPISQDVATCITEFNETGQCVEIIHCTPLFKMLQNKAVSPRNVRYLIKAQCGFEGRIPKVCCLFELNKMPQIDINNEIGIMPDNILLHMSTEEERRKTNVSKVVSPGNMCGVQTIYPRILGGNNTYPGEFPWSALLVYRNKSIANRFLCGGVLISRRYVVTAAHCITSDLVSVRLGEYDTDHQGEDCLDRDGQNICSGPSIDVPIHQIIIHPKYNSFNLYNDIGLIRLNRQIEFNDYIQRICLPTTIRDIQGNFASQKFIVSGWGFAGDSARSNIQLKLSVEEYEFGKCNETYASLRTILSPSMPSTNVSLSSGQFCAGGLRGQDACEGDSGGPLIGLSMRSDGPRWVLAGVVSFATSICGTEDVPGVYTKVWNYIFWMKEKLPWLIVPILE